FAFDDFQVPNRLLVGGGQRVALLLVLLLHQQLDVLAELGGLGLVGLDGLANLVQLPLFFRGAAQAPHRVGRGGIFRGDVCLVLLAAFGGGWSRGCRRGPFGGRRS